MAYNIRRAFSALSRKWKDRRVVYTERVIVLAHADGEKLLDVIPLNEIISIQDCDGIGSADADDGAGRIMLEISLTVIFFSKTLTVRDLRKVSSRIGMQTE